MTVGSQRSTVTATINDWLAKGLKGHDPDNHVIPLIGARKLKGLTDDEGDEWLEGPRQAFLHPESAAIHSILQRAIRQAQAGRGLGRKVTPQDPQDQQHKCKYRRWQREAPMRPAGGHGGYHPTHSDSPARQSMASSSRAVITTNRAHTNSDQERQDHPFQPRYDWKSTMPGGGYPSLPIISAPPRPLTSPGGKAAVGRRCEQVLAGLTEAFADVGTLEEFDADRVVSPKFLTVDPATKQPRFVVIHAKIARGSFARWLITKRVTDTRRRSASSTTSVTDTTRR